MVARVVVDGRPLDIHVNRVDPEFFQTMGITIRRGRTFHPGEQGSMIVSESLAGGMWPGQEALGQRFENHTVVGIAGSARQTALQDPDAVEGYFPAGVNDSPALTLLVKAASRAEDLSPSIAGVARSIDPALVPEIRLLKASFRDKVQETELTALAVGLLGISALVLACVGIVGLVAYSVAQRTKEIGIRMALGASGVQVVVGGSGSIVTTGCRRAAHRTVRGGGAVERAAPRALRREQLRPGVLSCGRRPVPGRRRTGRALASAPGADRRSLACAPL